jgi:hypothetical protein
MDESKVFLGFEPTAVKGKWFEVNDIKYSTTGPLFINNKRPEIFNT